MACKNTDEPGKLKPIRLQSLMSREIVILEKNTELCMQLLDMVRIVPRMDEQIQTSKLGLSDCRDGTSRCDPP